MHRATIGGVSDTAAFHRHGDAEGCSRGCARRTCQGHRRERCRGVQQYRDVARANIRRGNIGPTIAAQVTHEHAFGPIPTVKLVGAWNVPFPLPSSRLTLLLPLLATTRSRMPSPLKSWIPIVCAPFPA